MMSELKIREQLTERIMGLFGHPTSETKYVYRWHVNDGFDVVIERRGTKGKAWIPHHSGGVYPACARIRSESDKANSNVYSKQTPSLLDGEVVEMNIATCDELDAAMTTIAEAAGRPYGMTI